MKFDEFTKFCETCGETIVCNENKSEVRLETNGEKFYKVKFDELEVDEFKFRDESRSEQNERCDFVVFLKDGGKVVLFIEIKGSDLQKAWSQILNSMKLLQNIFTNSKKYAAIAYSGTPKAKTNSRCLKEEVLKNHKTTLFIERQPVLKYKNGMISK